MARGGPGRGADPLRSGARARAGSSDGAGVHGEARWCRRGRDGSPDAADQAWLDGDTDLALLLYLDRLEFDPADGVAALRAALIQAWSGDYDEALELLNVLIQREPRNGDARLARARVRAWSGDLARAQREVEEILAVQPENAEALEALALFQAWAGNMEGRWPATTS